MTMIRFYNQPATRNVMDNFFGTPANQSRTGNTPSNIYEHENAFVIELAVPGYSKENFSITLEQQMLTIAAEEKQHEITDDKFFRREFGLKGVNRSYALPKTVDTDNITADYNQGILSVRVPLLKEARIKKEIVIS